MPGTTHLAIKGDFHTNGIDVEHKIPNANSFINTPEDNKLTKLNFEAKLREAKTNLAAKAEVNYEIDLRDKNLKKQKQKNLYNLYRTTTLGTVQKLPFWRSGHLMKHLYKRTTS